MAEVIRLDSDYISSYSGKLKTALPLMEEALTLLNRARMSSGWFSAQRDRINSDIDAVMKEIKRISGEVGDVSDYLNTGAGWFKEWESYTQGKESVLASELAKVWGFEGSNWNGGNVKAPVTPVPQNPSSGGGTAGQNMNSDYYTRDMPGVPRTLINPVDGKEHMNCVYYARARAMEANGLSSYAAVGSGSQIQANSIAHFPGHDVFIENVVYENGQPSQVVFTESNWGGTADGHQVSMSYSEFVKRGGSNVNRYTYF
jgi:hypothetical protein